MKAISRRALLLAVFALLAAGGIGLAVWLKQKQRPPDVTVGLLFSGTGPAAPYGKKAEEGALLAIEQFLQRQGDGPGALRLRVVREDTASLPRTAVAAMQKLVTSDGVAVVLGPESSSLALACAPLAKDREVVLFAPTIAADTFSTRDGYTFRNWPSAHALASRMAEVAYRQLGYRRVGVLNVQNDMGESYQRAFVARFKELGGVVPLNESYGLTATDFRARLGSFQDRKLDALYVVGQAEMGLLLKQKAEMGISLPVLSGIGVEDAKVVEVAGRWADGILYTAPIYDTAPGSKGAAFEAAYSERFGHPADIFAATSYDAANLVLATIAAGARDAATIRDKLFEVKDYPGVTGKIAIDPNGNAVKEVGLKKIVKGRPQLLNARLEPVNPGR